MKRDGAWDQMLPVGGRRIPVPAVFRHHETGELIRECIECGNDLVTSGEPYLIEKAFRTYSGYRATDTVFEYALCLPCMERLHESYSKESKEAIQSYFQKNLAFGLRNAIRLEKATDGTDRDLGEWIGECALSGRPVTDLEEYQVAALCHGDELVLSHLPWLLSGEAIDPLLQLLSNATIDQLDDFSGRHFGLPPEFDVLPRRVMPIL